MPTEVEIPDIGIVEFPDELSEVDVSNEIRKLTGAPTAPAAPIAEPPSTLRKPVKQSPFTESEFALADPEYGGILSRMTTEAQPYEVMQRGAPGAVGITPEMIPSGASISESPAFRAVQPFLGAAGMLFPETTATVGSSIAKTGLGVGDYLTSRQGITELVGSMSPLKLIVLGKWAKDMAQGAGEQAGTLTSLLDKPDKTPEDWQAISDASVNTLAMLFGAGGAAKGTVKPIRSLVEPKTMRAVRELDEMLRTTEPASIPTPRAPQRQLGIPQMSLTAEPFFQPGIPEMASAALREAQGPRIEVPGEMSALEALRREIEPPQITPVEAARLAERIPGGGEAPYGKVSYMREAEAPTVNQMRPIPPGLGEEITAPSVETVRAQRELEARQKGQNATSQPRQLTQDARSKVMRYEEHSANALAKANELAERGKPDKAEPFYELSARWLMKANEVKENQKNYTQKGGEKDALYPQSQEVSRNVQQPEVAQKGAEQVPVAEGSAKAAEARVEHTLESDKALYKDISDRMLKLVKEGQGFSPLMEVLKRELEVVKNRHDGMPPGQTSPARKTMQAQQEAMKAAAINELAPAVRIGGKVVSDPNKGHIQMALEIGGPDALADVSNPANQGFVYKGEFISREAASSLIGEKTPLTSERLRELRSPKPETTPEVEAVTALDPRTGSPLSATESLINRLESLKFAEAGEGRLYSLPHPDAIRAIGRTAWNSAVDVAIASVKAGKVLSQAVEDAIAYLRKNVKSFNEEQARANLGYVVSGEAAGAPPAKPPATTAAAGAPTPKGVTLDDVYKRFEPGPKDKPGFSGSKIVESVRTGLATKFRPIDKLAEDIGKAYGVTTPKGIAGIFEQLKGSTGKAEADIYRFDRDVSRSVKGSEKDFNAYMFLRRSLDRLNQDLADIQKAQAGGDVKTLNRRQVAGYTIPELEAKLALLESKIGPEKVRQFEATSERYQQYMDQSLRLQVESGRMSQEVYNAIKQGNEFYAPFKVMKYFEEVARPEGTGRKIDTVADYTKAMEGIEDASFRLGDMLGAARQNIMLSRILAEKNNTMRRLAQLAEFDVDGIFIRKLKPGQEPARDMMAVNVKEAGKTERYEVNRDVADAVQAYSGISDNVIVQLMGLFAVPMKAGATAWNIPFQISNLMADVPRQALVSKFGVKSPVDLVRYPLDIIAAIHSSVMGDVLKRDNKLFLDFLDSGAAGTTFQEHLTPEALRFKPSSLEKTTKDYAKSVLYTLPDIAKAVEQTSKIVGVRRAMRETGAESGAQLARQFPEAITEIRRFSGSPDFGRQGKWVEQARLNLLYMFFNARLQGTIADLGRLGGRDGAGTAAKTWFKLATAIGLPTAYLYALNNSPELKEEYRKRPLQERQNYWLIPKDSFITNEQGEKMRDYWRIPKRESSKWIANMLESSLDFAEQRSPEQFGRWVEAAIEDISPLNVSGDTMQERMESTAASLNPVLKAPIEMATGRDLYRHREIVPESMQKASPELQYTERTPEVFRKLAEKMPDVAPEVFRSPLMLESLTRNLTAGLFTQFLPRRPVEGREGIENAALLQRFQSVPYTDSAEFDQRMKFLEREAADTQLTRFRDAKTLMDANKGKPLKAIVNAAREKYGPDVKLIQRIVDLYVADQRGITTQERRIISLPVQQRAAFLADEFKGLDKQQKEQLIRNYANKRILTEDVAAELTRILEEP